MTNMVCYMYIILINDLSDSNHSSKFTVLVVVAFTKEEKKTKPKTNHTYFVILVNVESWRVEINNILRSVLLSMSTMSTSNFEDE